MIRIFCVLSLLFSFTMQVKAQQPRYQSKHFVAWLDTSEFKTHYPPEGESGSFQSYIFGPSTEIMDLDDDSSTFVLTFRPVVICIEGKRINGKREGILNFFVIDSLDHSKRYKIWEQDYKNDQLDGEWRTYTLRGTLRTTLGFKNDQPFGYSRTYWIDGRSLMEEQVMNGSDTSKYTERAFYDNGKVRREVNIEGGKVNGMARSFYEDGSIQEEAMHKNGELDGIRKYYYPNGRVWIEQLYKDGKPWTVIANYTDKGVKRNAGTLKNGNGSLLLYNEDGTLRETLNYRNGEQVQ